MNNQSTKWRIWRALHSYGHGSQIPLNKIPQDREFVEILRLALHVESPSDSLRILTGIGEDGLLNGSKPPVEEAPHVDNGIESTVRRLEKENKALMERMARIETIAGIITGEKK